MTFAYRRRYTGKIRLIVTDLAGTTVDYGSRAPAGAFLDLFDRHGIRVAPHEARGPMGMHKRDHIRALLALPAIADQWRASTGGDPCETDVEALYREFLPLQTAVLPRFCDVIPGVTGALAAWRREGIRVAATTGYDRDMTRLVLHESAKNGFIPDLAVTGSDVPAGRPAPWMALQAAQQLGVYPLESAVKIGDTVVDIEEGLNAGMWSVGVVRTGNMLGLSREEDLALDPADREARLAAGRKTLLRAGAHYVLDGFADLLPLLPEINARLAAGEKP